MSNGPAEETAEVFFLTIAADVAALITLLLFFLIAFPIQRAAQTREVGNLGNGLAARPEDTVMPSVHPKTHTGG